MSTSALQKSTVLGTACDYWIPNGTLSLTSGVGEFVQGTGIGHFTIWIVRGLCRLSAHLLCARTTLNGSTSGPLTRYTTW